MTVSATPTGTVYAVTNTAPGTEYALTFPYIEPENVKAYFRYQSADTVLVYGTDYGVNGQVLVSMSSWPQGAVLAIYRETDPTQEIDWVDGQRVYTPDIEQADDKLTMLVQEVLNDVSRAVKVPRDDPEQTPEELIQEVYIARDAASASATDAEAASNTAQSNAASASQSAFDAAASRDAAAESESLARKWAEYPEDAAVVAGHYSAFHWAQKALEAATEGGKYSDALDGTRKAEEKVAASEWALGQVNGKVEDAMVAITEAIAEAQSMALAATPTGDIRLLPFRFNELPFGWRFCNGDLYPLSGAVGAALEGLPDNYKTDWGIIEDGENISIPNMFYVDGRGYYLRCVDGVMRLVGSIEQDQMQGHQHGKGGANTNAAFGGGVDALLTQYSYSDGVAAPPYIISAYGTPRYGTETSVLDRGMTPAIFLGV